MSKKATQRTERILVELNELEANQHSYYYKHEQKGRERMALLLLELNAIEKENRIL